MKFITDKVSVYFKNKSNTFDEKATVYWSIDEEYRTWGIKSLIPCIHRIIISYIEDKDSDSVEVEETFTDVEVENYDGLPLYPHEVLVGEKIIVDFGH